MRDDSPTCRRNRCCAAAALAALPLAGCAGGPARVVTDTPSAVYSQLQFSYAAGERDLRTEIAGNPFALPQDEFERRVTALMQGQHFGPPTHFTPRPGDSARPGYKVVLVFNPAVPLNPALICGAPPVPTRPPGGPIMVQAAFCGGGTLTSSTGWIAAVEGPSTPAFRALISDLTRSLFPVRNPIDDNDDDRRRLMGS